MVNNNEIKQKKQLLEHPHTGKLVCDVLMEADILTHGELQAEPLAYGLFAMKVMNKLFGKYNKVLKKENRVQQIDLEDSIKSIKDESKNRD